MKIGSRHAPGMDMHANQLTVSVDMVRELAD